MPISSIKAIRYERKFNPNCRKASLLEYTYVLQLLLFLCAYNNVKILA